MEEITITIHNDGSIHSEVKGVQGGACSVTLDKILKGLAAETTEIKKPEYFVRPQQGHLTLGAQ